MNRNTSLQPRSSRSTTRSPMKLRIFYLLDRASRDLSRRSAMNEAAKRRKILSLGREPQEHGMEKLSAAKRRQITNRRWLRLTPQPQSVAPPGLRMLWRPRPGAHAPGYISIAPSALDRWPAATATRTVAPHTQRLDQVVGFLEDPRHRYLPSGRRAQRPARPAPHGRTAFERQGDLG